MGNMTKCASALVAIGCAAALCAAGEGQKPEKTWTKVLAFDVLDNQREHKADLGNHKIVIASVQYGDWEIGVFNYPVKAYSEHRNLLSQEHNWHGITDWMIVPNYVTTNKDERTTTYDHGKSKIKIVIVDCQLKQIGSNSWEFAKGTVEVFHKP